MFRRRGHIAVQVAKIKGAKVTAVCSTKNVPLMESYGVDHVICYDSSDVAASLRVLAETEGLFDCVFDSVSSDDPRYHCTQ